MENPVDKQAKLQDAMSRAKKLIQLESNGTLDKIAKGVRDGVNTSLEGGDIVTEQLMTTPRKRRMEAPVASTNMGGNAINMNVPAAIRESFSKNQIDESSLYSAFAGGGNNDLSFLTEGIQEPIQTQRANVQTQDVRQIVSEGLGYQQQYVPQVQASTQVDYPMIRTIVEEIVRKYAVSLKNKIINEGANSNEINTISLGKTFKFLDSKGNIYECQMKKISNINEMKNKRDTIR